MLDTRMGIEPRLLAQQVSVTFIVHLFYKYQFELYISVLEF